MPSLLLTLFAFVLIVVFVGGAFMLMALVLRFAWRLLVLTTTPTEQERRMWGR